MSAESAAGRDELFDSAKPQQRQMLTDRQTEKPISPSTLIYILYAQKYTSNQLYSFMVIDHQFVSLTASTFLMRSHKSISYDKP